MRSWASKGAPWCMGSLPGRAARRAALLAVGGLLARGPSPPARPLQPRHAEAGHREALHHPSFARASRLCSSRNGAGPTQEDTAHRGCTQNGPHPRRQPASDRLTILHFNDVYEISPRAMEPVGGAARFVSAVRAHAADSPLVLFSGDCLNPSLVSSFTRGEHMAPILNSIGVHAACVGNHDFDFGMEVLRRHVAACSFPWLLSNVLDPRTGRPPAGLLESHLLTWRGVRVGLLGIVEREWLATLACVDLARDLRFLDPEAAAARLAADLVAAGAELVLALTHMRAARDARLAAAVPGVQLVLAGHDHHWGVEAVAPHGTLVVKSGTDFREFTRLELALPLRPHPARPDVAWARVEVGASTPPDPPTQALVAGFEALVGAHLDQALGWTHVGLDARGEAMRGRETGLGNLLADAMRVAMGCQVAFFNGGTVRSDQVHAAGQLTTRDVVTMLPFTDELVAVELTGADLLRVLETGVGAWPEPEGRFLQVSGLRFAFDPARPPGARVDAASVRVGGAALDPARRYSAVTKAYLRDGRDGFACMRAARPLRVELNAPSLATLVRHLFFRIQALNEGLARGEGGKGASAAAAGKRGDLVGARQGVSAGPQHGTRTSGDVGSGGGPRAPAAGAAHVADPADSPPSDPVSPTGWSPEVLMQPYEAGLEKLYCFDPGTGKWGVRPKVEGRIRCVPGCLPEPGV
ncbi:FAP215 [Auxenochlorella protothecoides x Auxenochlorella symbiontica]